MPAALDPLNLTPAASLNRVRLLATPPFALPPEVVGMRAYDLLAACKLAAIVREEAAALGLLTDRDSDDDTLLRRFDACFVASDAAVRAAADRIARRFGRALGALVLTLRRGDPAARAARPDWDERYWRWWAGITTIIVGGGLVSGRLGPRLVAQAARTLAEAGMTDCTLELAARPGILPLVGAARSLPPGISAAIVYDFGHSFIKRARTTYDGGLLVRLDTLPPRPSRWLDNFSGPVPQSEQLTGLAEHMVGVLAETWRGEAVTRPDLAPQFVVSLAAYMRDGQPLTSQGGVYAALSALGSNLATLLAAGLGAAIDRPCAVTLLHDGTAAARAYAGRSRAAVILLGTSLGGGFAPPAEGLAPLAPDFSVS